MMGWDDGDKDEYRFYPADFDDDGNLSETETDPAPLAIIGCFGVGLGFLAASFFADPVAVYGTDISFVGIATAMFALGLIVGGGSYIRQGRVRLGIVHIAGALGWLFIALGRSFASSIALVVGSLTLITGAIALFVLTWYSTT